MNKVLVAKNSRVDDSGGSRIKHYEAKKPLVRADWTCDCFRLRVRNGQRIHLVVPKSTMAYNVRYINKLFIISKCTEVIAFEMSSKSYLRCNFDS